MKAGWKNRIEERRYFEEKREKQREAKMKRIEMRCKQMEMELFVGRNLFSSGRRAVSKVLA